MSSPRLRRRLVGRHATVCALAVGLALAGCSALTPRTSAAAPFLAAARQGVVVRRDIPAPQLGVKSGTTYIYLPPGYARTRARYPVLYLDHGWPGYPVDWFTRAGIATTLDRLIAARAIKPLIVVAPESGGGWVADTECLDWRHAVRLETYLTRVVVHAIDSSFRTRATRASRLIGGYSSGAFCAVNIGLRHLDEFAGIAAIAPFASPGPYAQFGAKFGTYQDYLANLPLHYLPRLRLPVSTDVFLASGSDDGQITRDAESLAAALRRRGQPTTLDLIAGQTHVWAGVRQVLPTALRFASVRLS